MTTVNYEQLKKDRQKMSVPEMLTAIYNKEFNEIAITNISKRKLETFVLEIFNKGILTDYLNLK